MVEDVLGCKWTVELLGQIAAGHRRPGRLRRAVAGISPKVMNERLAKLTGFGVLERRALSEKPLHVEYHLTAKGRELAALVAEIRQFCGRWDASVTVASAAMEGSRRSLTIPRPAPRPVLVRPPRPARSRLAASP
jgi:DNA-binding HxlR family transcriptional regulator